MSTRPIFLTSGKGAFTLELPQGRSPLCPQPQSGLFQFPLRLEDACKNAHGDERVGMLCAQLLFKACERFALQLCGLAARGGAAGEARQTGDASARHLQEFTRRISQFYHVFILPITTMKYEMLIGVPTMYKYYFHLA